MQDRPTISLDSNPFGYASIYTTQPSDQLRSDLTVGDVTGDGIDDIIAGYSRFGDNQSHVAVVRGDSAIQPGWRIPVDVGISGWSTVIFSSEYMHGLGRSLANYDVDLDGRAEILIGANYLASTNTPYIGTRGSVFVLYSGQQQAPGLIFADGFESGNVLAWH